MRPRAASCFVVLALRVVTLAGQRTASEYRWDLPPGVPEPRLPVDAPITPERVQLGRYLFYDTRLSGNGTQSCAACHIIEALAFTEGRSRAVGSTGDQHPRSSMSLVNVAYRDALTWANPTLRSLEEQVLVPMFGTDPVELGLAGHATRVYGALAASPIYQRLFAAAFPQPATADDDEERVERLITTENVALSLAARGKSPAAFERRCIPRGLRCSSVEYAQYASSSRLATRAPRRSRCNAGFHHGLLAAFQRSIVSFRSPYDRYRFHGDDAALCREGGVV